MPYRCIKDCGAGIGNPAYTAGLRSQAAVNLQVAVAWCLRNMAPLFTVDIPNFTMQPFSGPRSLYFGLIFFCGCTLCFGRSLPSLKYWYLVEGSLEIKLPTIWRDGKAEGGRVTEEKIRDGESPKREDAGARKGRKVKFTMFFQWFCGSGWPKSNLAKAAGAEPSGQMRDEKVHAVVARSKFASQNARSQTTFGSCDVEKVHAVVARSCKSKVSKTYCLTPLLEVDMSKKCTPMIADVARSTCPSQNVQSTPFSDHSWKLRCRKSARRCGTKHICKSKVSKTHRLRPLLEVEMSKKCARLWREANFQVKSVKHWGVRTTFWRSDVEKLHTD